MDLLWTVVVGLLLLVAAGLTTVVVAARARRSRIDGWAQQHGWTVVDRPTVEWAKRLPGRGRVSLLLHGVVAGRPAAVARYSWTEHRPGDNGGTYVEHPYVVTWIGLPHAYPQVAVERRGAFSRMGRAVFGPGSRGTGNAAFDRQFTVRAPVVESAGLVTPALVHAHLRGLVPTWSLEGPDLITWEAGGLTDPHRIPALVAALQPVADMITHHRSAR